MQLTKMGDLVVGTCLCVPTPPGPFPAVGVVSVALPMTFDSGIPIAGLGNIAIFPCGTATIVGPGSVSFMVGGIVASKTGDSVVGCATGTVIATGTIMSF